MRKTVCAVLACVLLFSGAAGGIGCGTKDADPVSLSGGSLAGDRVKWFGRHYFSEEDGGVFFSQSASGFEVRFSGTGLRAKVMSQWAPQDGVGPLEPTAAVSVDGETDPRKCSELVFSEIDETEYVLADGLAEGEHTVRLCKKSESSFGKLILTELTADGTILKSDSNEHLKIAVFGDSITCGYGVDSACEPGELFSTRTENACKTYAYLTARMLDADLSVLSASGWGMKEGLSADTELPLWFEFADIGSEEPWNVSAHPADLVIVTLGANDNQFILKGISQTDRAGRIAEYKAAYTAFLDRIFEVWPKTKVLCCYGFLNETNVYAPIREISLEFRTKGRTVYDLQLSAAGDHPPIGLHGHPGFASHLAAADEIVKVLETKKIAVRKTDNLKLGEEI